MKVKRKNGTKPYTGLKRGAPTVFKPEFYVKAFRLAQTGISEEHIADGLGISRDTLYLWKKKDPAFADAIKQGRMKDEQGSQTFEEYVFNRLSPELQELWEAINQIGEERNAVSRIEALLEDKGRRARQHLLLQALIHFNFNLSDALRSVNVSRAKFDRWVVNDPDFAELLDQMEWHKKNFFEGKLVELVRQGDPKIVQFVNSVYNADRGYGMKSTVKKEISVSGSVNHHHKTVDVEDLGLDVEGKRNLLNKIRNKKMES